MNNDNLLNIVRSYICVPSSIFELEGVLENNNIHEITNCNVVLIRDMSRLFAQKQRFNISLNCWNVSSVTNMSEMFADASSFNQPLDRWDVSSVTDMSRMFAGASIFDQPLNKWNVSSVTNMRAMFAGASTFNRPISRWDVRNVTNMSEMFAKASSFNQPLDRWDVSSVTDMSRMFAGALSFNRSIAMWNLSSLVNQDGMFEGAFSYNQPNLLDSVYIRFLISGAVTSYGITKVGQYVNQLRNRKLAGVMKYNKNLIGKSNPAPVVTSIFDRFSLNLLSYFDAFDAMNPFFTVLSIQLLFIILMNILLHLSSNHKLSKPQLKQMLLLNIVLVILTLILNIIY